MKAAMSYRRTVVNDKSVNGVMTASDDGDVRVRFLMTTLLRIGVELDFKLLE